MTQKPEETIARLLELSEEITKGEWVARKSARNPRNGVFEQHAIVDAEFSNQMRDVFRSVYTMQEDTANTEFAAQAANSIPAIRQLLAQLAEANEQVKHLSEAKTAMLATMAVMGEALEYIRTAHGEQLDDAWEQVNKARTAYEPFKALVARLESEQFNRSSEATDGLAEKAGAV